MLSWPESAVTINDANDATDSDHQRLRRVGLFVESTTEEITAVTKRIALQQSSSMFKVQDSR